MEVPIITSRGQVNKSKQVELAQTEREREREDELRKRWDNQLRTLNILTTEGEVAIKLRT